MNKRELFRLMSLTGREEIIAAGKEIEGKYPVTLLKKPQKMLVMLKIRESAKNTLFYAGEALACECSVAIEGAKGFAACLGDDGEKAYAMAVIDAALNADLPDKAGMLQSLAAWNEDITRRHALDAGLAMATKVNFTVMEE